jgi:N-acetylneuraminate synthase
MFSSDRTYVVAEAGVNHNGSLKIAQELVEAAALAGVDAIKFQLFKTENIATPHSPKAPYQQVKTNSSESQFEMLKQLEFSEEEVGILLKQAKGLGIDLFASVFDLDSLEIVKRLDLPLIKIASGEITNAPLLLKAAQTGLPIILSTGMCNLGDIELALGILSYGYLGIAENPSFHAVEKVYLSKKAHEILKQKVTLLHCTSEYPAPVCDVHLRAMDTLRDTFGLSVGYSDHTLGIVVSIAAAARGATVIEKHLTIDHHLSGPDHQASLDPGRLKELVQSIREIKKSLGLPVKAISNSEWNNRQIVRKSLVAAKKIQKGDPFTPENLTCKRPGTGISPLHYWDWLGKLANRDYEKDEVIKQ